jgi:hypothetical protein
MRQMVAQALAADPVTRASVRAAGAGFQVDLLFAFHMFLLD